jgi:ABC-2 type transport system ATP-binding protein
MLMRAGFSVTMALEPDVFLVDEVLAVGDESFKQKCLSKVRQMREDGSTIVFVTHELSLVRAFCDRVILMENGEIAFNGEVEPGIDTYCDLIGVDKDVAMSRPPINQRTLDKMEKSWKRGR